MLLLIREKVWAQISEQFNLMEQAELSKHAQQTKEGWFVDEKKLSMQLRIRVEIEVGYANGRLDELELNKVLVLPTKEDL